LDDRLFNLLLFAGLAILIGLELRSSSFRKGTFGRSARTIRNWSFLGGAIASAWILRLVSEELSQHLAPIFVWDDWIVLNLIACFLVADLIGWLLHWVKHRSAWLWRFHFPHHRERTYDVWLVSHTHAIEVVAAGTCMSAILILLGFSPLSISAYFLFYGLVNTYQHSSFDYSLGPLDKIIAGPAYHRLHHEVGSDTNFGDTLTIWDVVFRTATWPEGQRERPIGIGDGPEPYGFIAEMTWFLETDRLPETPARTPRDLIA
jgi:sterol desaturase/sphingolipid hydroxylase (fatty acid hydroxylase superfamily)